MKVTKLYILRKKFCIYPLILVILQKKKQMKTLLITTPFTQINTAYPAIMQLSGFLKENKKECIAYDLSILVINKIFTKDVLTKIFEEAKTKNRNSDEILRIIALEKSYVNCIDNVIKFLQGKDSSLAFKFVREGELPQGKSFEKAENEELYFGNIGVQDKAKYYCSLLVDDLVNFISDSVTPHFGLSKYAEKIATSLKTFDSVYAEINRQRNIIENIMLDELDKIIRKEKPNLMGFSIPFPGNLLSTLICSAFVKSSYPDIKITVGGGYVNTELREITDRRIFEFVDYITYDDGELPLLNIIENIEKNERNLWVRTLCLENKKLIFKDNSTIKDYKYSDFSVADYSNIKPENYIAMLEMTNPMHRLWSDGFWNKLTLAHGCYWNKCAFCDIDLDYINRYSPANAIKIVDTIEKIIAQTGKSGFHFTDEAAPPSLLREISVEILKRELSVTWWGNIRFEKSFTKDTCELMAKAGCIAVTGGLEVAEERLLKLINKGVTLNQAANVCKNFQEAGIMVHAYLMYGFPTQTEQEIVDSLEIVRQFFELELLQSAFWHRFILTKHSQIFREPENFKIQLSNKGANPFANNDVNFVCANSPDYDKYSFYLEKAIYNFMHGACLDFGPEKWFDFPVPKTKIKKNAILNMLKNEEIKEPENIIWLGSLPKVIEKHNGKVKFEVHTNAVQGDWEIMEKDFRKLSQMILSALNVSESERYISYADFCKYLNENLKLKELWFADLYDNKFFITK